MSRSGLRSIEALSAGRTMVPCSSIHTAIGMLMKPNRSPVMCMVSMSEGCVGLAASIHLWVWAGSTSRATVTTVTPSGSSSEWSACHPGRLVRQPQ